MGHAFTSVRDALETAAVIAGNYYLPGSSLVTSNLVSNGAQNNLNSTLGQVANIGSGLSGSGVFAGADGGGIPSSSTSLGGGWTNTGNNLGSLFGDSTLGTDIGTGADSFTKSIGNGISNSLSDLYNGSALQSGVDGISSGLSDAGNAISNGLGFSSPSDYGSGLAGDFSNGLASAPSSAASSAPGSIGAGFTPGVSTGGSLGGGTVGGFFQDPGISEAGNSAGGFFSPANQALDNSAVSGAMGGTGNVLGSAIGDSATGFSGIDSSALQGPIGTGIGSGLSSAQTAFDNAGSQVLGTGSNGVDLTSIFGGGGNQAQAGQSPSLLNNALRGGLSSIFNQNPYAGSPQVAGTLNASAQQYNPYVQAGSQAQTQLSNLYGLNGQDAATGAQQDWQNTPGYQFQLAQGTGALQNSAAAQGGLLNGNTGEALQQYGQGLANTTYQQYLSNLQNQAGTGQAALGNQASLQGQAAQLSQQPKQYNASQINKGIGGLLGSIFGA